jgi:hypothetical protein
MSKAIIPGKIAFPQLVSNWGKVLVLLFATIAVVAGLAVLYTYDPAVIRVYPPCLFHALTGWHCPGCGTARGLHQLLHGNLVATLWLNPLMVISLPLLAYLVVADLAGRIWNRRMPGCPLSGRVMWMVVGVVIVYWIARNLPFYPFSLLAP